MTTTESPRTDTRNLADDDDDMFDKELGSFIENEEKQQQKQDNNQEINDNKITEKNDDAPLIIKDDSDDEELDKELEQIEKGQKETSESKEKSTDDEDSEPDDYHITDDQKRALEELDNQKSELGIQDEDPPEYNVKERLKELNQELANDPTPMEKQGGSRVGFKDNLVDLVAPPPDYGEDDEATPRNQNQNNSNSNSQDDNKQLENSESINSNNNSSSTDSPKKQKDKVLIERGGKYELVSSDDVTANDLGLPVFDEDIDNNDNEQNQSYNRQPVPPSKPRPSTANGQSSRRTLHPAKSQRAQSAGVDRGSALNNFSYNSPYGLSKQQKELGEEQKKKRDKQRKEDEEKKKQEEENRRQENEDAFQYWLKQTRERDRKRKQQEEEQKKQNHRESKEEIRNKDDSKRTGKESNDSLSTQDTERNIDDSNCTGKESNDSLSTCSTQDTEAKENEEAYNSWLKSKSSQIRHEKLLHKRAEQEAQEGFYIRSRQDCDKAFRKWLRKKYEEAKKTKADEKQRARIHRLAARRSRKTRVLASAVRQSNAFRYVDYYGYRY